MTATMQTATDYMGAANTLTNKDKTEIRQITRLAEELLANNQAFASFSTKTGKPVRAERRCPISTSFHPSVAEIRQT